MIERWLDSADGDVARDVDWVAVGLELIPLIALAPFAIAFVDEPAGELAAWFFVPILVASGFGWWRIGRRRVALGLITLRTAALGVLAAVGVVLVGSLIGSESRPYDDEPAGAVVGFMVTVAAFALAALVSPVASAVLVARASRIR